MGGERLGPTKRSPAENPFRFKKKSARLKKRKKEILDGRRAQGKADEGVVNGVKKRMLRELGGRKEGGKAGKREGRQARR